MAGVRWLMERSRSVSVCLLGGHTRHSTTAFEGFQRIEGEERHLGSGLPDWCQLETVADPGPEEAGLIGEALDAFAARCGGKAALRYTAVSGSRLAVGDAVMPKPLSFATWSLSGFVETRAGRRIPIGWSGTGTGLERLRAPATAAAVEWLAVRVDMADMLVAPLVSPAVSNPTSAALLLHETVGHFAEADAWSDTSHRLGTRIASDLLQVWDDPTAHGGAAQYEIDDEGVEVWEPTVVVREGVLVSQLHSLATAARVGAAPTGNGRTRSAWDRPLPRISNLICEGGKTAHEDLLLHLGDGLYIHQLSDGFGLGRHIEARLVLGEWVQGGKLTGRFVTAGRLVESVDVLRRVVELGGDATFRPNALCGKAGQVLFDVGTCAPSIRFTLLRFAA